MKICIFTHTHPRFVGDTAAPFMETLSESMASFGHSVFVLTPFDKKIDTTIKRPYKLVRYRYIYPDSLHILGYGRTLEDDKRMGIWAYIISPFLYLFGFLALLSLVKKEKIDIVSAHWIIPNGFITALVNKLTSIPYTVTIPGSDIYMGGKNFIFKAMVGFAANNASFVISDSTHYLKQLNELGFFPERTSVIRYGVDTNKFRSTEKNNNLLKKLSILPGSPIILAVGRMVAKKGFTYLIDAMSTVVKKIPGVRLVIVGDGDKRSGLEEKVKKYKIEKNVIFPGMISYDELSKYYNIADAFVMPSIRDEKGNIDASPVSMMEAMACGVPVVATNFAGSEELVINGVSGYRIPPKNSKEIADSIVFLLSGRKGHNMKHNVRRIALTNFSEETAGRKYLEVFKEIV